MHCQPDRGSASVGGVQHIVLKQIYLKSEDEMYSLFISFFPHLIEISVGRKSKLIISYFLAPLSPLAD